MGGVTGDGLFGGAGTSVQSGRGVKVGARC